MLFGCFYLQLSIFGEVKFKSLKHKFLFSVFIIFFIFVFIALGSWQIVRLNWKNNLILEIENSLKNPPVELTKSNKENFLKIRTYVSMIKINFPKYKLLQIKTTKLHQQNANTKQPLQNQNDDLY